MGSNPIGSIVKVLGFQHFFSVGEEGFRQERDKPFLAKARYDEVEKTGNFIAYIIDGAGNFQRESALTTICQYSHCTIAYTDKEFDVLIEFIREKIG